MNKFCRWNNTRERYQTTEISGIAKQLLILNRIILHTPKQTDAFVPYRRQFDNRAKADDRREQIG